MKKYCYASFLFTVLFINTLSAQTDTLFSFRYNGNNIAIDTFKNKTGSANVKISKKTGEVYAVVDINMNYKDSIRVSFNKTAYFPQKIKCTYNNIPVNNAIVLRKSDFKNYTFITKLNAQGKSTIEFKFMYTKQFHFYDLFVLPAIRHLFPEQQLIEMLEIS